MNTPLVTMIGRSDPANTSPKVAIAVLSSSANSSIFERSRPNAVWTMPSASPAPLRRTSRSLRSPISGSPPAAANVSPFSLVRTRPTIVCPAWSKSRTIADPIQPFAPVRKTRILVSFKIGRPHANDRVGD